MITNEWILGNGDLAVPLVIRKTVFIDEQKVPPDIELDEDDNLAMHLVIRDADRPVATGRIWHDGTAFRIGRCAVLQEERGQGIGDLLVKLLLLKAFEFNPSRVIIHAQTQAKDFYSRYGFEQTGEPFDEAGIEHIPMEVTKETLLFPSKCGHTQTFEDLFQETEQLES